MSTSGLGQAVVVWSGYGVGGVGGCKGGGEAVEVGAGGAGEGGGGHPVCGGVPAEDLGAEEVPGARRRPLLLHHSRIPMGWAQAWRRERGGGGLGLLERLSAPRYSDSPVGSLRELYLGGQGDLEFGAVFKT